MRNIFIIKFICLLSLSADINIITKDYNIKKPIKSWIEFKNENLTKQQFDYSCGAGSLSTILTHFYDKNITEVMILDNILKIKKIDKDKKELENSTFDLSFADLTEIANLNNFKALGLAIEFESLYKIKSPVILYVKIRKNEHFTVFKAIDEHFVYLADPSMGNIKVKLSKFKEMFFQRNDYKFKGKILAVLPNSEADKLSVNKDFMKIEKYSNLIYEIIKDKFIKN